MGKFTGHTITSDSALGDAKIQRSLRFNDDDSPYLERTPSGAGSNQMTFSFWIKRGNLGGGGAVFSSGENNARGHIYFDTDDKLNCQPFNSSGANTNLVVDRVFRDTTSWYHVVLSFNNTAYNDTASTVNVYVNGVSASFTPTVTNTPSGGNRLNDSSGKRIGELRPDSGSHLDGYLAEFNFIDGQVLDSSYFGFTDPVTSIWMPKRYEGTYGTNGFYLDFSDNSSTTSLGIDKSPNGNDFTTNNFSVSAGVGNDSVTDTPTNNFATLNPLSLTAAGGAFTNGNLDFTADGNYATRTGNISLKTGKWYWEVTITNLGTDLHGIVQGTHPNGNIYPGYDPNGNVKGIGWFSGSGGLLYGAVPDGATNGATISAGNDALSAYTTNDVLGFASDIENGTLAFYKNGSLEYTLTGIGSHDWFPAVCGYGAASTKTINFGQLKTTSTTYADAKGHGSFKYSVPSGFLAMCSANLSPNVPSIVRPQRHFDTLLYTGTGSANNIVEGLEFSPDMIWVKGRDTSGTEHAIIDSVRGSTKSLVTNSTDAESTHGGRSMTFYNRGVRWNSDSNICNANGENYVLWSWKGGSPKQITSGSVSFNDDGDYLNIGSSSDYAFGTGDYTIEAWVYHTSLDGQQTYVGDTYGNTAGAYFYKNSSNRLGIYYSSEISTASESFAVIPLNKWVHVAVSRNSGTTRIFQDGTLATNTGASDTTDLTITQYYIGDTAQTSGGMIGFISNVRILKGTGLYTSNFTPPTSPLTNISNTVFLGCQSPNSSTTAAVAPGSISATGASINTKKNPFDAFCIDEVPHMTASSAGLDGGTIDPTGASINTESGFSITTYTGNGTAGANVAHGLGKKPAWIIIKARDVGDKWFVYHHKADAGAGDGHVYAELQESAAFINYPNMLNDTAPTDTLVTLHSDRAVNGDGNTYVMYSWAEIPGYSKFGIYTGNGSADGTFVHVGFRPAWLMIKRTDASNDWVIADNKRSPDNIVNIAMYADLSNSDNTTNRYDFLSNGFKIRNNLNESNASGGTYIYMAFAEEPGTTPFTTFPNAR